MDRLIAANSVPMAQADTAPTSGTPQGATDGNPAANIPATRWPSYQYNAIQEELMGVLAAAGIAPDRTNNAQIAAAIKLLIARSSAVVGDSRNLSMSISAASASGTITADEIVVGAALGGQKYVLGAFSQTINLATTGAGGMDTGSAPASGYVAIYAIYNPTTGARALIAKDATSAVQPNVYGGANMPEGYTASALVSVWPTNVSRQLVVGVQGAQAAREVSIASNTVLSTSTVQASLTSFSAAGAIPPNARACRLDLTVGSSLASAGANLVVCGSSIEIGRAALSATSATAGATTVVSTPYIRIVTPQTLYYRAAVSAGTLNALVGVTGYIF
ncbi:hypothetical protein NUJ28_08310 [Burkholderia multivorans]|uniref:hypothetical protein n=1 Tax=Burkholderia multivorans TaxID=87883 RepID=UPI0021DAE3D7|nr:hypothetical protein [Burkholderia multivorans]UXZ62696.1 hypothetical protein NUJ28_08310 [Burkholderia multivorans]